MAYTTINKSTTYFNTKLYTGNGSSNAITGVGFQPDLFWTKSRTNGEHNTLIDAVRGVNYGIYSNTNAVEFSGTNFGSFDSDGFTWSGNLGSGNENSQSYASWNWKAGTTGSGNTGGSGSYKSYSYSVNTTAGFSIVSYIGNGSAGHTIPHHLGVVPKIIIIKNRSTQKNWVFYSEDLGNDKALYLDLTDPSATATGTFNSTSPTSSVFTVGTAQATNKDGDNLIAYCFADKTGYSKFGAYKGNGNADGTFVYTGFKPTWIMRKCTASGTAENWVINDNKRPGYNQTQLALFANNANTEDTATHNAIDICSNGFKIRTSDGRTNGSGNNYIFMAFGQSLVGSNNVPCTAR